MQIFVALGAGAALIGILLAGYGVRRYRHQGALHARASAAWIRTRADILESRVAERERTDSNDTTTTWYEPHLRYRYAVDDSVHEGQRTALLGPLQFWQSGPAEQWLLAHAPGVEIDIWYDPDNPAESAPLLDKPALFGAAAMVFVGAGFAVVGVAMLFGSA